MSEQRENKQSSSKAYMYLLMIILTLTGSLNTILMKLEGTTISLGVPYNHPWFITFCMFLGEMQCMIGFWIISYKQKNQQPLISREEDEYSDVLQKPKAKMWYFLLPACCDFCGTTILVFGLGMMDASIFQMFSGSIIIFTALFSVIFLKTKLFRHHYISMALVVVGLCLVGLSSVLFLGQQGGQSGTNFQWIGMILVITSILFTSTQFVIEEKILKKYECNPINAVGWEGTWGSCLYLIVLIVFQNVKCPAQPDSVIANTICSKDDKGQWMLENTLFAFKQMGDNGWLCFYAILYIFSISFYNSSGIAFTKHASSAGRAIVNTLTTAVVWIFFLLPITPNHEEFHGLQLIGFIMSTLGTLIFNEILILPFCGLNKYAKMSDNEEERQVLNTPDQRTIVV
jgi:drug/metabolite transporter (DMT)-like permease